MLFILYYIAGHRSPRERRHNIFHPFSVTSFTIFFFYTSILHVHPSAHRRVYRTVNGTAAAARADYIIIILYTNDRRRRRMYRQLVYRIEIEHRVLHSSS